MKKLAYLSLAAASAIALASPAAAQTVTGTVDITGTVAAKCLVVPANSSTFAASVNLLELAKADGTLEDSAVLESRFTAATGSLSAKVICTSATPTVAVTASPLLNVATADPGYTNRIDYTANIDVVTVSGSVDVDDLSSNPAATSTTLSARLANSPDNVTVDASAFTATSGALLVAGTYNGQIVVTVTPT